MKHQVLAGALMSDADFSNTDMTEAVLTKVCVAWCFARNGRAWVFGRCVLHGVLQGMFCMEFTTVQGGHEIVKMVV